MDGDGTEGAGIHSKGPTKVTEMVLYRRRRAQEAKKMRKGKVVLQKLKARPMSQPPRFMVAERGYDHHVGRGSQKAPNMMGRKAQGA